MNSVRLPVKTEWCSLFPSPSPFLLCDKDVFGREHRKDKSQLCEGGKPLICSTGQFPWCKCSQHS